MSTPTPNPATKPLPPVRVELPLYDALNEIAQAQGRFLSSVIRAYFERRWMGTDGRRTVRRRCARTTTSVTDSQSHSG